MDNADSSYADVDYLPRWPRDKQVPIGCVGAGFVMDECHLVAYRQAGLRPVAIASRSLARATEVAARHDIPRAYAHYDELLADPRIEVVDIAVPPDVQGDVIRAALAHRGRIRGILAQKPLAATYAEAAELVAACQAAGVILTVNQNMRYDQAVRYCQRLIARGELGAPVLATIEMRAVPHWMPWQQRLGWLTLRIMSIHHLDTFRFWFGDPLRVFASVRSDPRTAAQFAHRDGICLYVLEYADGLLASGCDDVWAGPGREGAAEDTFIRFRVEGTEGLAQGTIGWPRYPRHEPSTLEFTTRGHGPRWFRPRFAEAWFPDAFAGPMAELLCALADGTQPELSGRDNLRTLALVEACYASAAEHRAVEPGGMG